MLRSIRDQYPFANFSGDEEIVQMLVANGAYIQAGGLKAKSPVDMLSLVGIQL
jgi:hypothetical protein